MRPKHLSAKREASFPNLNQSEYEVTSNADFAYNCIAYATDKTNMAWWPMEEEVEGVHWPKGVPIEETLEAFIAAYQTEGYELCDDPNLETGYEKVAIYADAGGKPAHAAKQLTPSGTWTSKLGDWEDIEHKTLDAVCCPEYGAPARFLKRKIGNQVSNSSDTPSAKALGTEVEDGQEGKQT